MDKFIKHVGIVAPLDAANVDTDAIIPKQFLQKVTRTGFGQHLFNDWRFLDDKGQQPNPDFVLNKPVFKDASILLARENFGCGSSWIIILIIILLLCGGCGGGCGNNDCGCGC